MADDPTTPDDPSTPQVENDETYVPRVMNIAPEIGEVGKTTIYVRRTNSKKDKKVKGERQLPYAQHLLETTTLSTVQVGRRAAFGTHPTFYRCFKAAFGMTPGEYRKQVTK